MEIVCQPNLLSSYDHYYEPPSEQWKNLRWLFDIGDYTTQLYGDYNKPL